MRPSAWRRAGSRGTEGRVRLDVGKNFFPVRVGEALAQVALTQRSCGCSCIPGSVQGQVGLDLEECRLVKGVPARG